MITISLKIKKNHTVTLTCFNGPFNSPTVPKSKEKKKTMTQKGLDTLLIQSNRPCANLLGLFHLMGRSNRSADEEKKGN